MNFVEILENEISNPNFKLKNCINIEGLINRNIDTYLNILKNRLNEGLYTRFKLATIRTSFLIELTNPDPNSATDSTKYQVRWSNLLHDINDIRYATYEQCIEIC